jgi:hypothetical protein
MRKPIVKRSLSVEESIVAAVPFKALPERWTAREIDLVQRLALLTGAAAAAAGVM